MVMMCVRCPPRSRSTLVLKREPGLLCFLGTTRVANNDDSSLPGAIEK